MMDSVIAQDQRQFAGRKFGQNGGPRFRRSAGVSTGRGDVSPNRAKHHEFG